MPMRDLGAETVRRPPICGPEGEAALAELLARQPLLAFDFDGTLARIVQDRHAAGLTETTREALQALAVVQQQLEAFATQNFAWQGQVWPGQQMDWEFATHTTIQVWSYPEKDHLRTLFEAALPGNPRLTSIANIAPDPLAMINSIASDLSAIGYCPDSWLEEVDADWFDQIKPITITPALTGNLAHPLLASVSESPSGELQRLFNCLQNIEH